MNILTDYHHQDLLYSLQLLLQIRLGHSVYRQIGLDWYTEGFWNVYPSPDTAEQYLGMRQGVLMDDYYLCRDEHNGVNNRAITLEQFKNMDIDVVIASIPQHIKPFKKLAEIKGAKFIFQMGNMFTEVLDNLHEIPNLLASSIEIPTPSTCNSVFYHQEFDLSLFKPSGQARNKQITSFINILPRNARVVEFYTLKGALPEYGFKSYGAQCDDGIINTTQEIAEIMQSSYLGFHAKAGGDGYGHILFNWFACGVPIITRSSDYKDKLGGLLLIDGETCLDLDKYSMYDICNTVRNMLPEKYDYMSHQVYQVFKNNVDFEQDAEKVKIFLEKLQ